MDLHSQMLYEEFVEKKPLYEEVMKRARTLLDRLLRENHLYVVAVESRVKQESSLAGKLELKGYKYHSLGDITDLVGLRVVTFYADEVDRVSAWVENAFTIDWENSVDKRRLYSGENNDRFGYMSLHYIASLPKEKYEDPQYPGLCDVKFEIQMRTGLQHVWATAHHDTGYKTDVEIPAKYLREMNQLAGLLEIADNSIKRILTEITEYRRSVKSLVANGDFDSLTLDGDTFGSYMEIDPFHDLNERIAGINRAELSKTSAQNYLAVLKKLGFETIGDIEKMKKDCSELAYQLALIQLADTDLDILSSNIGLQNLCLVYIYQQGSGVFGLKEFYDCLHGSKERNALSAQRTLQQLEKVRVV